MRRLFVGAMLMMISGGAVLWIGMDRKKSASANQAGSSAESGGRTSIVGGSQVGGKNGSGEDGANESAVGDSHRLPLQPGGKPVEAVAVLGVLASGPATVDERVRQLQAMRGISFSKEECEAALEFLAGKQAPEDMNQALRQWLADELLTVMRLQDPPNDNLAADLAQAAFQPGTDPVVRDYLMQHLGHLWEQSGPRQEIDAALWRAVGSSDETTPGTALIALSRGYERDGQEESLAKVRQAALELARNPEMGLAVRVTALSIAGETGGGEVKALAAGLTENSATPEILKKVAERVAAK